MGAGGGGGGQAPKTYSPGEAAQAAIGTTAAGEMMSIANQPVEQYANLATMSQLGPALTQTQSALQNQAALQSARAQMDIQSQVDPMAYAQRQMRMQAANQRLGQLYGVNPSNYTYRAPGAYTTPGTGNLPTNLEGLGEQGREIASALSTAQLSNKGTDPQLIGPNAPMYPTKAVPAQTYLA